MILKCISAYRAGAVAYGVGQEIHASDEECERLLRDSPGSFERAGALASAPDRRARGGVSRVVAAAAEDEGDA